MIEDIVFLLFLNVYFLSLPTTTPTKGYFVRGVLDKNAIGAASGSLVHNVFEIYGPHAANSLLDALGRVLSAFLQATGHSCGIGDLVLLDSAEVRF